MQTDRESNKGKKMRYSICVSGAAAGKTLHSSKDEAAKLGMAVAKAGHILTTGATVGLPYYAALGAKEAGGRVIGFSPASSLREHLRKYRLPFDCFDFINFTGMNYVGRDVYLVQSSDAIITVGGRFGSLHEFTTALEANKPCGVLTGSGGTADLIPMLMQTLEPPSDDLVILDNNADKLIDSIIKILDRDNKDIIEYLSKFDEHWYLEKPRSIKETLE